MYIIKVKDEFFISIEDKRIRNEQAEIYKTYEEAERMANAVGGEVYKINLEKEGVKDENI